jgi:hypothetical protein
MFASATRANCRFIADANTGHVFGIFMALCWHPPRFALWRLLTLAFAQSPSPHTPISSQCAHAKRHAEAFRVQSKPNRQLPLDS